MMNAETKPKIEAQSIQVFESILTSRGTLVH